MRHGPSLLTQDDVIPLFLDACRGIEPIWQEHLDFWGGKERGIYNDASEIARYVIETYERGEISTLVPVFSLIERIIREGDDAARDAAIVGVIESIQVQASHYRFGSAVFVPMLGPLSRLLTKPENDQHLVRSRSSSSRLLDPAPGRERF